MSRARGLDLLRGALEEVRLILGEVTFHLGQAIEFGRPSRRSKIRTRCHWPWARLPSCHSSCIAVVSHPARADDELALDVDLVELGPVEVAVHLIRRRRVRAVVTGERSGLPKGGEEVDVPERRVDEELGKVNSRCCRNMVMAGIKSSGVLVALEAIISSRARTSMMTRTSMIEGTVERLGTTTMERPDLRSRV